MNIEEILQLIIAERDKLNIAIAALQGVGAPKRRGRPRKNPLDAVAAATPAQTTASHSTPTRTKTKEPGPPRLTREQREAHSARMKKFWAEQREKRTAEVTAKAKKSPRKSRKPPPTPAE
jgi:hypothetical protein